MARVGHCESGGSFDPLFAPVINTFGIHAPAVFAGASYSRRDLGSCHPVVAV
jgi:hypothetical protein